MTTYEKIDSENIERIVEVKERHNKKMLETTKIMLEKQLLEVNNLLKYFK